VSTAPDRGRFASSEGVNQPRSASPAPVWDLIYGYTSYWALTAGLDLGLFDALADGELPVDALATHTGVHSPADLRSLADTLVSLGLLSTTGSSYVLTPASERFLVSTSPASMAALVRLSPGPLTAWPALADTLRSGSAAYTVDDDPGAFYPELVAATAPTQAAVARAVAVRLTELAAWPADAAIVDFGSGSGAWIAALLAARPAATAVAVELPAVLPSTIAGTETLGHRVRALSGDYLDVDLPIDHADVVVLAHVLRAESPQRAQALFDRAARLVGRTGVIVIADYPVPDAPADDETLHDARHDLLLALTMLASTRCGRGISTADLHRWSANAGMRIAETLTPIPRQTVFLIRPEDPTR
jgi:hypothetical protein